MSLKLKILGLGVLAVMATSAFAVMNAGASEAGHFGAPAHTIIKGQEGEPPDEKHRLDLTKHNGTEPIGCAEATYLGTSSSANEKSIEVAPTYSDCYTTEDEAEVSVTPNGCKYRFKVNSDGTTGTADLNCPSGKSIEIHHPNCTITVADEHGSPATPTNQTISGVHYTPVTEVTKAITLDVDVTFNTQYHGGICIFLGTNQLGRLKGSVTVWGENTLGERVDVTTTG